ncbi:MAG: hypothetical protein KDA69_06520 [Planctomycetaceae bacterium]|nr:hypothetical protein [Planctomycetaceae bacterium]MCA9043954.1 hypothetical protein [Planctomycetaceae bacterium]
MRTRALPRTCRSCHDPHGATKPSMAECRQQF